jgi:hypothetical protein
MKHIHDHRFAPANTTPQVDPARTIMGSPGQPSMELTEKPRVRYQMIASGQFMVQAVKLAEDWLLVGIDRQAFCFESLDKRLGDCRLRRRTH